MWAVKSRALFVIALLSAITFLGCGKAASTTTGDRTGVTDTEIKIGTLLPLSVSTAAAWGVKVEAGMQAYFAYKNDQGGIYGRKIKLIVFDDQYAAPLATEGARKLVEQDRVFAILGSLGTTAHDAVYKRLEENGVPDMFILSGVARFTDPVARNRFGWIVRYDQEGKILIRLIADKYPGKKLGILAQNDDFGTETVAGIKAWLQENGVNMKVDEEKYDETQTDVSAQTQRLKNAGVDVVVLAATPLQAASFFRVARETLDWHVPVFVSSVDTAEVVAQLAGYENIEGSIGVTIGKQAFHTEDPGIALHYKIIAKYASGTTPDNLTLVGATLSEMMIKVLEQAGPDLTRESFLAAAESMCGWTCSVCLVPVNMSPTDHRPLEEEIYVEATLDRSTNPATFKWVEMDRPPVDFESTKECVPPTPPAGYEK
jgi:branched-chain amino acid transport system substrate-binding protein